jgi:hypothetical protein
MDAGVVSGTLQAARSFPGLALVGAGKVPSTLRVTAARNAIPHPFSATR